MSFPCFAQSFLPYVCVPGQSCLLLVICSSRCHSLPWERATMIRSFPSPTGACCLSTPGFLYPLDCCWTSGLFPTWGIYVPPCIGGRATVVGVGAASASPWLCPRWPCPHEWCPLGPWPPQGCYGFCFKQQPRGLPAFPLLCVEPFADSVKLSLQGLGLFLCIYSLTWGSFQGHILGLDAMGGGSCEDRVWGGGSVWPLGIPSCVRAPGG